MNIEMGWGIGLLFAAAAVLAGWAGFLLYQGRELRRQVDIKEHELTLVLTVHQAINRQLELDAVLQIIADQARVLTGTNLSVVYEVEGDNLRLAVFSGSHDFNVPVGYCMPIDQSLAGIAVRSGQTFRVQDAAKDPRVYQDAVRRSGIQSFLLVPLISGNIPIGVISVANKVRGPITDADERILTRMASSAVISLENARLYKQAAEAAAMNERNRLARELHDSVTQSLFSASLIGDVLPRIWHENPSLGERRLEELGRLTRGALAEMRTMLLELRPAALEAAGTAELFQYLRTAFAGRQQAELTSTTDVQVEPSPEVKIGLYRIAQEALNNISRHAEAEHVWLALRCYEKRVELTIMDDGRGFDRGQTPPGHLGLYIMRERAEGIGAILELDSLPGEGTQIRVVWEARE